MVVVWGVLVFIGVVFACGISIGVYFDIRGWLKEGRLPSPADAPTEINPDLGLSEEPAL